MFIFSKQNRAAANGLPVTRRRALTGLAGLAAGSAVASPALAETPMERLERLTNELAEALVEWTDGQFMAVVYPANHSEFPSCVEFRNCRLPAHQRRDYHLAQFKQAAEEADPAIADWHVTLDESGRNDCSILIAAYRFTGSYDGDGIYEGARPSALGYHTLYRVRLAAKMGNSIDTSKTLQRTYMPVNLAAVRAADEARRKGRRLLAEERNQHKKLKLGSENS